MKKSSASSPRAQPRARNVGATKSSDLIVKRLRKDRPATDVKLRIPADLVAELKRVATALGFSDYESLVRAYIGKGLRNDVKHVNGDDPMPLLLESLRRRGVAESVIAEAVAETAEKGARSIFP